MQSSSSDQTSPTSFSLQLERYHGLDSMRAAMMLLGVVFHSATRFTVYSFSIPTPFHDPHTSLLFDGICYSLHLFRMQAFFVIAGFFAAFLYQRNGKRGMLRNRTKRVLVPLLVSWPILFPLTMVIVASTIGGVSLADMLQASGSPLSPDYSIGEVLLEFGLVHLWFLYYLMIYYIIAALVVPFTQHLPKAIHDRSQQFFRLLIQKPWGVLLLGTVTAISMYFMPENSLEMAGFESHTGLAPPLYLPLAYVVFFIFGWFLFKQRNLLKVFQQKMGFYSIAGLIFTLLYAGAIITSPFGETMTNRIVIVLLGGIAIWGLVFASLGFFLRFASNPSPVGRYLADASYWIYLIHVPIVQFLFRLFYTFDLPAVVKFTLVFGITSVVSLITYHYFVRSTFIGKMLNGRKYPRSLPKHHELDRSATAPKPSIKDTVPG